MIAMQDPRSSRATARAVARAVALVGLLVTGSCTSTMPKDVATPSASPASGISIPADQMTPYDRCMLDKGFRPVRTRPPDADGSAPNHVIEWEADTSALSPAEAMAGMAACRDRFAPYQEKTEKEIREIYTRWVAERTCLVELGYQPAEPPSVEKFVADWKTGPWDPITGLDTRSWTDAQYREAKERCTLEMFDRG